MAKDKKPVKPHHPSGVKSCSSAGAEEALKTKSKKRRRRHDDVEAEEAPVTNPDEETSKTERKLKKKKQRRESAVEVSEVPRPASCPEGTPEGDLSPEQKRVLERKLKKILKKEEKKRLKADGQTQPRTAEPGPGASKLALDYLSCWAERRSAWKFQKSRQTWLLQHMYDSEKIPDDRFEVLLRYLEGLHGTARETSIQKSLTLVEESGRAPKDATVQQRAQRAKEVIQLLS